MLLYHGMYNVPHFAITNSLPFETNTLVGDASDYKRLRKICYESGSAYINDSLIGGETIRGGAKVSVQYDTIFMAIIPDSEEMGIVITIKFFLGDDERMYAYADKRTGGGSGAGVTSFNSRTGVVVPDDEDYNADMIAYDNEITELVAETVQDAIDEICDEIDSVVEMIPTELSQLGSDSTHLTVTQTEKDDWNGKAAGGSITIDENKTLDEAYVEIFTAAPIGVSVCYAMHTNHWNACAVCVKPFASGGEVFLIRTGTDKLYKIHFANYAISNTYQYAPVS